MRVLWDNPFCEENLLCGRVVVIGFLHRICKLAMHCIWGMEVGMKKKKYLIFALCMVFAGILTACGKEGGEPSQPADNKPTSDGEENPGSVTDTEDKDGTGQDGNGEDGEKEDSGDGQTADNEKEKNIQDVLITMQEKVLYEKGSLLAEQKSDGWIMTNSRMSLEYNVNSGTAQIFAVGENLQDENLPGENLPGKSLPLLSEVYAKAGRKDGAELISKDLKRDGESSIAVEELSDDFGEGMRVCIVNEGEDASLTQYYYFYEELPYFFFEAAVSAKTGEIATNYIAPVFACKGDYSTNILNVSGEDVRFLFTPYDNDAFIRYSSVPIITASESYEVTAVFDNTLRRGMVVGSVTHDTWKTGIKAKQGGIDATVEFSVYGGASSAITRDCLPHGYVSGKEVSSPRIFLGFYEDYRDGLAAYGEANAVIAPPLAWDKGIPMGWNSWSAVADKVSYATYTDSSDFVKENLQDNSFSADGVVYINFDSFWDNLTEMQLRDAARHVRENGQIPGIYMTPFTYWGGGYTAGTVPGTDNRYSWQDIVLKDENGTILPAVDGGVSVDPTHPGTIMNIKYQLERFKEWGFAYVKMDFMSHGAREGVFYNTDITTGTQAYNYGMQQIHEILKDELDNQEFFISFSIAPMFPSQYAHSRRISCDVFGTIDNTEYMLNSLTYGWWMSGTIYPFTDPDHIVLYNSFNHKNAIMYNEGLSRYISAAIAGTMLIDSDDFRIKEARKRAVEMLTCEEINAVAKRGVAFRPVEGNTKDAACDTFVSFEDGEETLYLAVFNFDGKKVKTMQLDPQRLGLENSKEYEMYDLWSKETVEFSGSIDITLEAAQPKLFRVTPKK